MAASRILFIVLQLLTITISGTLLSGAFIVLYTTVGVYNPYIPVELVQAVGIVSGGVFVVSILGLISILSELPCLFNTFFVLSGLQIIFNLLFFVFFLLFVNGVETIPQLDNYVNDTINNYESELPGIALEDGNFDSVQNSLSCCGIDFESTYLATAFDTLLTGTKCFEVVSGNSGRQRIQTIQLSFPVFNSTAQAVADLDIVLGSDTFFCGDQLVELNRKLFLGLAIVLAITILFEVLTFLCSVLILRYVERDEAGTFDFNNASELNGLILKVSAKLDPTKVYQRNRLDSRDFAKEGFQTQNTSVTTSWGRSFRGFLPKFSNTASRKPNNSNILDSKNNSLAEIPPPIVVNSSEVSDTEDAEELASPTYKKPAGKKSGGTMKDSSDASVTGKKRAINNTLTVEERVRQELDRKTSDNQNIDF